MTDETIKTRVEALPEDAQRLLACVASLEEAERKSSIVEQLWTMMWMAVEFPPPAPDFAATLKGIQDAGLLTEHPLSIEVTAQDPNAVSEWHFAIDPSAGDAARESVGKAITTATRQSAIQFWTSMIGAIRSAREMEDKPGAVARSIVYASPYLLDDGSEEDRLVFVDECLRADGGEETWDALLPVLRAITDVAEGPATFEARCRLAHALVAAGRFEEAGEFIDQSLADAGSDRRAEALLRFIRATLNRRKGQNDEALAEGRRALAIAYDLGDKPLCCQCHYELAGLVDATGKIERSSVNRLAAGVIAMLCRLDLLKSITPQLAEDLRLSPDGLAGVEGDPSFEDLARVVKEDEGVDLTALLADEVAGRHPKDDAVRALIHESLDDADERKDPLADVLGQLMRKSPEATERLRLAFERCARQGVDALTIRPALQAIPSLLEQDDPSEQLDQLAAAIEETLNRA